MCRRTKITRGFNNFMQMSVLDKNKKFNQPYFGKKTAANTQNDNEQT